VIALDLGKAQRGEDKDGHRRLRLAHWGGSLRLGSL